MEKYFCCIKIMFLNEGEDYERVQDFVAKGQMV